jgi:sporulation protein YlmC with PRC-barrel domain
MYLLVSQLRTFTVISLQTGATVAQVTNLLVDPDKLEVLAYGCAGPDLPAKRSLLLIRDIRQYAQGCLIVNELGDISDADDIVRLKDAVTAGFDPVGMPVVTESKHKLGKVQDYSVNIDTSKVQRLDVKQPLFRNFLVESLSIDRQDILDVTPKQIVVRDATVKAGKASVVPTAPILPK